MVKISIVVPCFNEAERLDETLANAFRYLKNLGFSYEFIFVNDGSTDDTVERIHELCKDFSGKYRIISLPTNGGKGKAIHTGILETTGDPVFFIDADFSTPIDEAVPALKAFDQGASVVIASRRHPKSRLVVSQGRLRLFLGKGFTWITNIWLGLSVSDVTCGFKGFRKDVSRDLFEKQRQFDWSFDAEILFLATKRGLKIQEIPVVWTNRSGTKVNIVKDTLRSLVGLIEIRLNYLRGVYD